MPVRSQQQVLPLGFVRNRGLFANHWFDNRLRLEPEWRELGEEAREALGTLEQLWKQEKDRVERYGREATLEEAFIQPVFEALGWKLIYQTYLEGRSPDYALFLDDAAKDAALAVDRTTARFWEPVAIVADAKAWHVPLNRPTTIDNQREYPPQQIEWYVDRSRRDFGILTNGGLWRLVPREHSPQQRRFQTYLECDLAKLLESWRTETSFDRKSSLMEEFLEFYLFFGPAGYRARVEVKPLIRRAIQGSSEYRVGVGERLKERAFEALRLCIEGFLRFPTNELYPTHLEQCRAESFILLYRLLFIMYAEDRRLLPYRTNQTYTLNRSLGRHRDEIAGRLDRIRDGQEEDFAQDASNIWDDMQALFDLVDSGHRRYGVPEYNGGLFDPEAHPFLLQKRISDYYMVRIIDQLGRAIDPLYPDAGLSRVDYRDLAIQHLGGIYEGLLELQPKYALEDMAIISRRKQKRLEERYIPAAAPVPSGWRLADERCRQGSIYLETQKGERRASGSYYTPDHIVNYIVENTIKPVCQRVTEELHRDVAAEEERRLRAETPRERADAESRLEQLRSEFDERVLRLRILDPAMGSGHFLIRACQRLAEEIATHPFSGEKDAAMLEGESAVSYWKRRIVEDCLYGVDLNELAVELAKLALWLETVAGDEPLSFLNHHLRHGNSLVGGRIGEMGVLPGEPGLDLFGRQVQVKLPALLEPFARIREMPSATATQIREKNRLYRSFERAKEPFRAVGDLWCSAFCGDSGPGAHQYQNAVEEVNKPRRFSRLVKREWFQRALASAEREFARPFHWELEFPEAFFEGTARHADAGFDAVIGNPPYDVLSELENRRDLSAFKEFIKSESIYDASRKGKNNLYKLFICRALDLLTPGGHLGLITPMAVLGDESAVAIRRRIVTLGAFTAIEAFPQKDNPAKRVFPEAKLSTAVFTVAKSRPGETNSETFLSRVHPERTIEEDSPRLTLSTDAIPLYDPSNFTIVSCSQDDWDLATRITRTGRLGRLGDFVEFSQGEVNETNERDRGSLTHDPRSGKLVTRGAAICLYVVRPASQGEDLYLDVGRFLDGKGDETKAFHYRYHRVGLQESCPQNNFRRIIAAYIPEGEFCNHKINYCPAHKSSFDVRLLLGFLNSRLADWYFRLGSTNAAVSHYQLYNLPFPIFAAGADETERELDERLERLLRAGSVDKVFVTLQPHLQAPPFGVAVRDTIVEAVRRIIAIEGERGEIARTARSALAPAAQPYQDLIDRLLYAMAGMSAQESAAMEARLQRML